MSLPHRLAKRIGNDEAFWLAISPTHAMEHRRTGAVAGYGRGLKDAEDSAKSFGVVANTYWKIVPWRAEMYGRLMEAW